MDASLRNFREFTNSEIDEAIEVGSATPSRSIGITDTGAIAAGMRADLVAINQNLDVGATWIDGYLAFASESFIAACD